MRLLCHAVLHTALCLVLLAVPGMGVSRMAAETRGPDLLFYHGMYSETDLLPIVLRSRTEYRPSFITVVGLSKPLGTNLRSIDFEAEGNIGIHSGIMKHGELNGLLIARSPKIFGLPVRVALGEGLSIASSNPALENKQKGMRLGDTTFTPLQTYLLLQDHNFPASLATFQFNPEESRPVLNYLMVEVEMRLENSLWNSGIFMRIHHRSGVFGLYCPPDPACGSNFVTYGVKWQLP